MVRELTADETKIVNRLTRIITNYKPRNELKKSYYDAEAIYTEMMSKAVPREFDNYITALGWPKKAVDVISSRCVPNGYFFVEEPQTVENINRMRAYADTDEVERQAIFSAVLYGIGFIFTRLGDISAGEPPLVQYARSPLNATCVIDPRTRQATSAIEFQQDATAVLHLPDRVIELQPRNGRWVVTQETPGSGRVLCTAYINGGTPDKPYGQSRITPTLIKLTNQGVRTLHRAEVSAEFYSAPRLALINAAKEMFIDENGNKRVGWDMMLNGIWGIAPRKEEDGTMTSPNLQHVPQMTMQPFLEQFRMIAQAVAGETSIPISYLGVSSQANPASAQAIAASEMDLVRVATEIMNSMTWARKSLAYDMLNAVYGPPSQEQQTRLWRLRPRWQRAAATSITERSQFVQLQIQAGNIQPGGEVALSLLPLTDEEREAAKIENQNAQSRNLLTQTLNKIGENRAATDQTEVTSGERSTNIASTNSAERTNSGS